MDRESAIPPATSGIKDNWERIGYHRVIGGFYYNIIFAVALIGYVMLIPLLMPYPESMGYYNVLTGIFSSFFTVADLGTASSLARFVAEYRVKNPQRCVQYVTFFIWFQATTGLVQTTVISMIGLFALGGTDLSYMPWLFTWLSTVQYPGYLAVFVESLKGMQQYAKTALVGLINTMGFQMVTLLLGTQLGAYLGNANPQIGGIMGCAIGMIIGYYVDDFSTILISGSMFAKLIKPWGFRLRDIYVPRIPRYIAKESIKFGLGVMAFVLSYQSIGTIVSLIYVSFLPNYSSYVGIMSVLGPIMGLAETVNGLHIGNHQATTCEAYYNKKNNYAEYILSNGFRTIGQVTMLVTPLILVLGPSIIDAFFHDYLSTFYKVFIYVLVFKTIFQHSHLMDEVLIGTGHHKFNVTITIIEQIVSLTTVIVCIYLQIGIFVLIIPGYCQTAVKQGFGWVYITTRIINLRFRKIAWQSWVATSLSAVLYSLIIQALFMLLAIVIPRAIAAILVAVLGIYVLPGPGYFFWLGMLGGYDKNTMNDFKNAVQLAGPSKIVVKAWYACASFASRHSKLHGKFSMYYEHVGEEIAELMAMKSQVDAKSS